MMAGTWRGLRKCSQEDESQLTRLLGSTKHHLMKKVKNFRSKEAGKIAVGKGAIIKYCR